MKHSFACIVLLCVALGCGGGGGDSNDQDADSGDTLLGRWTGTLAPVDDIFSTDGNVNCPQELCESSPCLVELELTIDEANGHLTLTETTPSRIYNAEDTSQAGTGQTSFHYANIPSGLTYSIYSSTVVATLNESNTNALHVTQSEIPIPDGVHGFPCNFAGDLTRSE